MQSKVETPKSNSIQQKLVLFLDGRNTQNPTKQFPTTELKAHYMQNCYTPEFQGFMRSHLDWGLSDFFNPIPTLHKHT